MENLIIRRRIYIVDHLIKSGISHDSYLCKYKERSYLVKQFKSISDYQADLANYKVVKKYGINLPKLMRKDKKTFCVSFQYIDAQNMAEVIANNDASDDVFGELFNMYRFARFSKIDLNYLPENYKYYKNSLFYLSYNEFGPAHKDKNLENYGIYFWIYGSDCMNHLKDLGLPIDKSRLLIQPEVNKKIVLLSIMKW